MYRKLLTALLCMLLLCACTSEKIHIPRPTGGTLPTQVATEPATTPTTEYLPETTVGATEPLEPTVSTVPTEPTKPAHSELYLPDCTQEQMITYFEEVVLHAEYSTGSGDTSLVQKWLLPICYQIEGNPTEEDVAILKELFAQLNELPDFPVFYEAEQPWMADLTIYFLEPEPFREMFSPMLNGDEANGAVQFWYYTATNEIHSANVGYRTDLDQRTRSSILLEEIVNMLGLSDTVLRKDSIVYQYSDNNMELSDIDWVILKMLYDPRIQCGMDFEDCKAVIQELYY